jgi:hypothetical protein
MVDGTGNAGLVSYPGRTTWHITNQPADEHLTVHAVRQHDATGAIG